MKLITTLACLFITAATMATEKPNIVFLFCDDLGYGDVQILNPKNGKIKTPHIDSIAKSGMIPNLIDKDRPTVATFLKAQGYHTGIVGKWHLNFLYHSAETGKELKANKEFTAPVGAILPDGPTTRGFDYFHGIHHARSMKAIIEGDKVVAHDDEINFLPRITKKSVEYINERAKNKDQPFFLYVPFGSPHTPILPTKEWQGKSGINSYADFVMQNDDSVGKIIQALKDNEIYNNTLIIFSSDNGCSKEANIPELISKDHYPSADLRGSKADIWDGGHRVPFIVSWHGKVSAGSTTDTTICLTDIFSTCVDLLGAKTPQPSCEDSVSFLPLLKGQAIETTRKGIVHHSVSGHFAYRMGDWKLALAKASGGWTAPTEAKVKKQKISKAQLYNLAEDLSEQNNLYTTNPEKAQELLSQLEKDVISGRSTEGPPSKNDIKNIKLWKNNK